MRMLSADGDELLAGTKAKNNSTVQALPGLPASNMARAFLPVCGQAGKPAASPLDSLLSWDIICAT